MAEVDDLFLVFEEFVIMADRQIQLSLPNASMERQLRLLSNKAIKLIQELLTAKLHQNELHPSWLERARNLKEYIAVLKGYIARRLRDLGYEKYWDVYFPSSEEFSDIFHVNQMISFFNVIKAELSEEERNAITRKLEKYIQDLGRWRRLLYQIIEIRAKFWKLFKAKNPTPKNEQT